MFAVQRAYVGNMIILGLLFCKNRGIARKFFLKYGTIIIILYQDFGILLRFYPKLTNTIKILSQTRYILKYFPNCLTIVRILTKIWE